MEFKNDKNFIELLNLLTEYNIYYNKKHLDTIYNYLNLYMNIDKNGCLDINSESKNDLLDLIIREIGGNYGEIPLSNNVSNFVFKNYFIESEENTISRLINELKRICKNNIQCDIINESKYDEDNYETSVTIEFTINENTYKITHEDYDGYLDERFITNELLPKFKKSLTKGHLLYNCNESIQFIYFEDNESFIKFKKYANHYNELKTIENSKTNIQKPNVKDYKAIQKNISNIIPDESLRRKYSKYGVRISKIEKEIYKDFGFSTTKCKIHCFWLHIAFYELEKILCPIIVKNDLFGDDSYTYKDNYSSFNINLNIKNQLDEDKNIKTEKDLKEVCNLFIKFYKEDVLPFFEKWNHLNVLYRYIKTKDEEELWDILGQFAPMSKAIIYRLCNDESALEFMESYYQEQKGYYDEDPKDEDNINYHNASTELKEVLKKIKPIYNL